MAMVDVDDSSYTSELTASCKAWSEGRQPFGTAPHSSDESGEHSL